MMDFFYPLVIVILILLSVFDLVIGVINDSVNFLNSAIGSKVASIKKIMIFASLGILLGTLFSSGMMDITRKEIFDPSLFCFSDVMFIFLSVMISDIILLNIFNSLGLPTSTTVSMIFCVLGGSFSIAILKIILNNLSLIKIFQYIKIKKVFEISFGIFISIIFSFLSGSIIHYFIRLLFGFDYDKKQKIISILWGSISLSSMTYFLIIKGLYNTMLLNDNIYIKNIINLIKYHFYISIIIIFIIWILFVTLYMLLNYNIFKFVVLYGTFSLAMAFSGNDLVNFIGIPISGIQSYYIWSNNGYPTSNTFRMKHLSGSVKIPSFILIISGLIMIFTLWTSKKKKHISDTEISLSRQKHEVREKYVSSKISRYLVRYFLFIYDLLNKKFPSKIAIRIEKIFNNKKYINHAAFDLLRASSNLTISSILISFATIKKLPVSTTFVTFMVSMGTSLSDRAWNRDSAVYRVSGVINVIRGWLLTGLIAFTISGIISYLLYFFKFFIIFLLVIFCCFFLIKKSLIIKKYGFFYQQNKKIHNVTITYIIKNINQKNVIKKITIDILYPKIKYITYIYNNTIQGIILYNLQTLNNNKKNISILNDKFITDIENSIIYILRNNTKKDKITDVIGIFNFYLYYYMKYIINSMNSIIYQLSLHIMNSHTPLKDRQKIMLLLSKKKMLCYVDIFKLIITNKYYEKNINFNFFNKELDKQLHIILYSKNEYKIKSTFLIFNFFIESKKIYENIENVLLLCNKYK